MNKKETKPFKPFSITTYTPINAAQRMMTHWKRERDRERTKCTGTERERESESERESVCVWCTFNFKKGRN